MRSTIPLLGALAGSGHQEGASFLLFLRRQKTLDGREAMPPIPPSGPRTREPGVVWLGGGLEGFVPLQEMSSQYAVGPGFLSHAAYTLRLPFGTFGAAIQAGAAAVPTSPAATSQYVLITLPVALSLRLEVGSPFFLSTEVAVGAVINNISFAEGTPPSPTTVAAIAPYISSTLCVGRQLGRHVRVAAGLGFAAVLFSRPLLALCPVLRVEHALDAPSP
jgi:hypothetical protein